MLTLLRNTLPERNAPAPIPFGERLPAGKLVEISGGRSSARLSTAVSAVWHAQASGDTAVWIQPSGGSLYPPDLHECGIDLSALPVVHVPRKAGVHAPFKAAELLLRSGAFGLVVLDLRETLARADTAAQGRLLGLAREHESRVVLLTTKPRSNDSLGPLVSLRIEPSRRRIGRGTFLVEHHVLKDKQGLGLDLAMNVRRGLWGLR